MSFSFDADTLFGSLGFLGIALAIAGLGLYYLRLQVSSAHWPTVEGRVTHSEVVRTEEAGFAIRLSYSYEVDGHTYTHEQTLDSSPPPELIAQAEARAALGRRMDIAYNPRNPKAISTTPGELLSVAAFLLLAFGFVAIGAHFVHKWWF